MNEPLDSMSGPDEGAGHGGQPEEPGAHNHATTPQGPQDPQQAPLDFGTADEAALPGGTLEADESGEADEVDGSDMTDAADPHPTHEPADARTPELWRTAADELQPLPGELGIPDVATSVARQDRQTNGRYALALMGVSVAVVSALALHRLSSAASAADEPRSPKVNRDRPAATATAPRTLDMGGALRPPPSAASGPDSAASSPRIPGLVPTADERAEPIAVRRTGTTAGATAGPAAVTGNASSTASPAATRLPSPEDAPILLASSRPGAVTATPPPVSTDPPGTGTTLATTQRNLQAYQEQLRGLVDRLQQSAPRGAARADDTDPSAPLLPPTPLPPGNRTAPAAVGPGTQPASNGGSGPGLFGGQLQASATPRVMASQLGQRSLTLPKGTAFTCALKTRVISATSGLVGCQVQRNVYGDDGRVLLIERGSHLDGEYRVASVRPGTVRIPVLWTRVRTPLGVVVDLDSPGTGPLGESGMDGHIDNRWGERIGAALLLSLIDDSVKLVIQNQTEGARDGGNTIVLPSTTADSTRLAEKVLESTINIPPLLYQNQGGLVGIYVARDVDFSSVYALTPTPVDEATPVNPATGAPR